MYAVCLFYLGREISALLWKKMLFWVWFGKMFRTVFVANMRFCFRYLDWNNNWLQRKPEVRNRHAAN